MKNKSIHFIWWFLALALLVTSIVLFIITPEFVKLKVSTLLTSLVIFLCLGFINRVVILSYIQTRYFRNLLTNIITVGLVLCILGMINYLGFKNNKYFDLTQDKLYSLSDQSQRVLSEVDKKMKFTLFARRGDWDHFLSFLKKYEIENKNISLTAIDIDTQPALVELHKIKKSGTVIIEYDSNKVSVDQLSELNVTNQIIKILRNKNINVYYTIGHSEVDPSDSGQKGSKFLFQKIKDSNYSLRPLDLLKVTAVPTDADVIIILGPKKGFLDLEVRTLEKYLESGGNLFITFAPEMTNSKLKNLYDLVSKFGISYRNSIVVDRLATVQGSNATIPIITHYNTSHNITKNFSGRTLMPLTGAIEKSKSENIEYSSLMQTSNFPASWAETNIKDVLNGKAAYDKLDIKGPVTVAASSYHKEFNSKVIALGSSSFFINGYETQSNNYNIVLNMLAWLVDDEGIISINRPGLSSERIFISMSQEVLILFFLIICSPTFFFGISIYMYRRRLNK